MTNGTLLIRLQGLMQSWDTQKTFRDKGSGSYPSKSGVCGLIMSSMGVTSRRINDENREVIKSIFSLSMGVRIDNRGKILKDFHTASGFITLDGSTKDNPEISNRYYLNDANFLVALNGDIKLLAKINEKLKHPIFHQFLGRKCCVPSSYIWIPDGLKTGVSIEEALKNEPYLKNKQTKKIKLVLESDGSELVIFTLYDNPVLEDDRVIYSSRKITEKYYTIGE